jgi:two-component system phosphate regulon sensor histidine kinase PhoR
MTEEEREDALLGINRECLRMERLSQTLLQLIVLKQGADLVRTRVSVSDLLESVRDSAAELLRQRGLTLQIDNEMDALSVEPDLMTSLLLNLIDNAGKASHPGDTIELIARGLRFSVAITAADAAGGVDKICSHSTGLTAPGAGAAGGKLASACAVEENARLHEARLEFVARPPGDGNDGNGGVFACVLIKMDTCCIWFCWH